MTREYSLSSMIGGEEYKVANGTVSPAPATVSIPWAMWSMDIITPLSTASLDTTAQGEETIVGRLAEKYNLDTAKAPPGTAALRPCSFLLFRSAPVYPFGGRCPDRRRQVEHPTPEGQTRLEQG